MARGDFPSAKQDQFNLRFPAGMRDLITASAESNGRSMNAEIVARLQRTLDEERLIKAGPKELSPDSYLSRMTEERLKFEALLRSYQEILQGYTPADIARMFSDYETLRKEIEKTGLAPDTHPFKSQNEKT